MKTLNYIFFGMTLFCLGTTIYLLADKGSDKTAYFLSAEVYNEFDYKKELELELESTQNEAKLLIDSLELDLEMHLNYLKSIEPVETDIKRFEEKQGRYLEIRDQLEIGYSQKSQDYYNKIWDRINGYVNDYGKKSDFTYIFGANGDGSIMYAEENQDITDEIITIINKKYAGEI